MMKKEKSNMTGISSFSNWVNGRMLAVKVERMNVPLNKDWFNKPWYIPLNGYTIKCYMMSV